MIELEFECTTVSTQKYALFLSFACLVLTFFKLVNIINYLGATYAILILLLGKTEQIKYVLVVSGTGCFYDMFYVIFYCSRSSWVSVRFILFVVRFAIFLSEVLWLMSLYCSLKQQQVMEEEEMAEQAKKKNKKPLWFGKKLSKLTLDRLDGYSPRLWKSSTNPVVADMPAADLSTVVDETVAVPESAAKIEGDDDVTRSGVETTAVESSDADLPTVESANDVDLPTVESANDADLSTVVDATMVAVPESAAKIEGDDDVTPPVVESADAADPPTVESAIEDLSVSDATPVAVSRDPSKENK